jgi:hypothetical protein
MKLLIEQVMQKLMATVKKQGADFTVFPPRSNLDDLRLCWHSGGRWQPA